MNKKREEFKENLNKEFETSKQLLKGLVGNYTELVEPGSVDEAMLAAIAFHDERSGLIGQPISDDKLNTVMREDKDYPFVTAYYLYCNWRVWATYKHNKELAEKYQKVCDEIDDYVFDNWDEAMIAYFVQKTD